MSSLDEGMRILYMGIKDVIDWCYDYANEIWYQLIIAIVAYLGVCIFLYQLIKFVDQRAWQLPGPPNRLLLVIAHPDDEVMFFGPMIYWLTRASRVYLLCMSIGTFFCKILYFFEHKKFLLFIF